MRKFICLFLIGTGASLAAHAQSIIGDWQLLRESTCMDDKIVATNADNQQMIDEMKSMAGPTRQVVSFREKMTGEENTRILSRKKATNNKSFLYKFDGESLLILDKKSHTLTDNYIVDKFSADSLIISNSARPCEVKIFLRIN
jgi:hypothetical protein